MSDTAFNNDNAAPFGTVKDMIVREEISAHPKPARRRSVVENSPTNFDLSTIFEQRSIKGATLLNHKKTDSPNLRAHERSFTSRLSSSAGQSSRTNSRSPQLRLLNPRTIERVASALLPTEFGDFQIIGYRSVTSNEDFVVLALGELQNDNPTLVRIHSQCMTGDVFGSLKCDCGQQLRIAMEMIARAGRGAIVYQQQEGRGIGIINKIRAYALQDQGADTIEANVQLGLHVDARQYEQCAEILLDLGLRRVRVMSNNPGKIQALEQSGLEVEARIPLEVPPTVAALRYLRTKKEKMGHLLQLA